MGNCSLILSCCRHVLHMIPIIQCIPRFLLYFINNVICPPMFCFWFIMCQPLKFINQDAFYKIFGHIFDGCVTIIGSWLDLSGHSLYECGDDISQITYDEAVLIANHQSPNDIGTLMRILQEKGFVFNRVVWIMDWLMQFFHFGWVSKLQGDFFLLQTNDAVRLSKIVSFDIQKSNQHQLVKLRKNLLRNIESGNKKWIILFPEGGFLRKRRPGSQRYARKNGFPVLENVALPRTRAFFEILNTLGTAAPNEPASTSNVSNGFNVGHAKNHRIKWIIDVTIGYDRPLGILEYLLGACGARQVIVHYKCIPAHDLFKTKEFDTEEEKHDHVRDWLYEQYVEKEKLLAYFYKYNNFPSRDDIPNDTLRFPRLNYYSVVLTQLGAYCTLYILVHVFLVLL